MECEEPAERECLKEDLIWESGTSPTIDTCRPNRADEVSRPSWQTGAAALQRGPRRNRRP